MQIRSDYQLKAMALLTVGHFTVDCYTGFVAPLVPVLQQHIGFSLTEAAFLISVFSLSSSLAQTGFGFLFDRFSHVHLVALGPLWAGVNISCMGLMSSYPALVLLAIAGGLGVAAFHPQGASLAGLKSGYRHRMGMSIFVTGGTLGIAVGALTVSFLVEIAGLRATVYAMFPAIVVAFLIWRYLDYQNTAQADTSSVSNGPRLRYDFLLGLWGLATLRALVILGFHAFVPLYLTGLNTSLFTVGLTLFVFGFSGGLGGLTAGRWAEIVGDKNLLYASYVFSFPLLGGYLLMGTNLTGLACLALAGYTISSGVPIIISVGQRSFPKSRGTISSVVMGLSFGTAALMITPAGVIADQVGIYAVLWGFAFVSLLGFFLALLLFGRGFIFSTQPVGTPTSLEAS